MRPIRGAKDHLTERDARPACFISCRIAKQLRKSSLRQRSELGEGGAALAPQRVGAVEHLGDPVLLRQRGQADGEGPQVLYREARLVNRLFHIRREPGAKRAAADQVLGKARLKPRLVGPQAQQVHAVDELFGAPFIDGAVAKVGDAVDVAEQEVARLQQKGAAGVLGQAGIADPELVYAAGGDGLDAGDR